MNRGLAAALLGVGLAASVSAHSATLAAEPRQLLQDLVDINSDTRNLPGLAAVRQLLIPRFEALGLRVTRHPVGQGREVLSFDTGSSAPKVLLVGHIDTVFAADNPFRQLREEGDRLIGPGVIDMKGGIVLLLNVLSDLRRQGPLDGIRVVLNDDEEIGSPHSKEMLRTLARGIPYGLVFEPGLEDGAVVNSQSGVRWMRLTAKGKAAHAGLEPQNGINACVELAHKVTQVAALAKPERGLTVNPGVIEGGTKANVVCEKASVTVDVRFRDLADWHGVASGLEDIRGHSHVVNHHLQQGTTAELQQLADMPPLPESSTRGLVQRAEAVARSLGQGFRARGVGYGSDGNHLAETGMQLLVGVGPYGGGMHSDTEFMRLSAYSERLALMTALVGNLITTP